jgi:hypothetical protein
MQAPPKWFKPAAITALLWNLLGCAAYLSDVMMSPEALASLPEAQRAIYAARPAWAVGATAIAVWGGALGSLGLILRKRWAFSVLVVSLVGIVLQDLYLFGMSDAGAQGGSAAMVLQGLVFLIGIALVWLARKASQAGWLS